MKPAAGWIALGIGVGIALGNAFDQMSIGVGVGSVVGVTMFLITRHQNKNDKE